MGSFVPLYDVETPNKDRGLQAALWRQSLQSYASNDPRYGVRIRDDFTHPVSHEDADGGGEAFGETGWYGQEAAANGSPSLKLVTETANPDGILTFNVGDSAAIASNHEGGEWHYGNASGPGIINLPSHSSDDRGRVVADFRLDLDDLDVMFVGFAEPGVDFLSATSTLPDDEDYIGYWISGAGEALEFVSRNDNDGGTAVEKTVDVVANADLETGLQKIGFAVNKDKSVDIVVNDKWYPVQAKTITSGSLPIESLTLKVAITRGDGSKTTLDLPMDSYDVFVEQN